MIIFILLVYVCYLVFQLFSHKNLYDDHHASIPESVAYGPKIAKKLHIKQNPAPTSLPEPNPASGSPLKPNEATDAEKSAPQNLGTVEAGPNEEAKEEEDKPQMDVRTTIALLVAVTVVCRCFCLLTVEI
jgi:Ca2+:H+ antiporter